MFLTSCAIALSLDPLFLYVPVIKKDNKCVASDKGLKIIAISLRSLTDMIYVANIILQFISPYKNESLHALGRNEVVTDSWKIAKSYLLSYFLMDILAILPLPQVRELYMLQTFSVFVFSRFFFFIEYSFKFRCLGDSMIFPWFCHTYACLIVMKLILCYTSSSNFNFL